MPTKNNRVKRGFTLIELLVVIAIIAILAAILFPVFQKVRERARITTGLSNAKQIGLAIIQYYGDTDEKLPLAGHTENDPSKYASQAEWQNAIYSYVKSDGAYKDPDDSIPVGGPNQDPTLVVPSFQNIGKISATSFIMGYYETSGDSDGIHRSPHSLADFTTPAQFILLREGQRSGQGGVTRDYNVPDHAGNLSTSWLAAYVETTPNDAEILFNQCSFPALAPASLPYHKGGEIFAFLDGHVKYVAMDVQNPLGYLNANYPPCKYTRPSGDDPSCSPATPPSDFVPVWQTSSGCNH